MRAIVDGSLQDVAIGNKQYIDTCKDGGKATAEILEMAGGETY